MNIGKWIAAGVGIAAVGGAAVYAQYRNTEQPDYLLVMGDGDFELREYPELVVAEVTHIGDRRRASGASFRRLADYIFAKDRPAGGESIAMTAPVLQQQTNTDTWRMRFIMPSEYTLTSLPRAPADITLVQVPARRMASLRFSGAGGNRDLRMMEARLTDWLATLGLEAQGPAEFAFYDAPMVPGPLRRNEVLMPVNGE